MSAHGLTGPRSIPLPPGGDGEVDRLPRRTSSPRHLRLVGAEELAALRRRRRVRLGGFVLAVFIIGLLFAAVAMHVVLAQNQFRLDHLATQAAAEQARYQKLRLQVDQLESPQRIIGTAEGRLGMVAPAGVTYLAPASSAATGPSPAGSAATGRPSPGAPPAGWAQIKPQLAANP